MNDSNNSSHLTAVGRTALPLPVRWLLGNGLIHGDVLDYGCGRCAPLNIKIIGPMVKSLINYDPYYFPTERLSHSRYDVILCTYVLCVLPEEQEQSICDRLRDLLKTNGVAYITVRNDKPRWGWGISKKGTLQRKVELPFLFLLRQTRQYRTYLLTK